LRRLSEFSDSLPSFHAADAAIIHAADAISPLDAAISLIRRLRAFLSSFSLRAAIDIFPFAFRADIVYFQLSPHLLLSPAFRHYAAMPLPADDAIFSCRHVCRVTQPYRAPP